MCTLQYGGAYLVPAEKQVQGFGTAESEVLLEFRRISGRRERARSGVVNEGLVLELSLLGSCPFKTGC